MFWKAREERRRENEATDLLAAAGAVFDASLDPRQTMRTIARTAIPALAELCVIDLVREDGVIGDSVVAAVDEETERRLGELRAREPLDIEGPHPVARALRARAPVVVHDLTNQLALDDVAQSDEHLRLIQEAGYRSAVVMTLTARGRLLGALSFLHVRDGSPYDPAHLPVMQELANRAAMALDNARLYDERARIARTLQRSLLPEELPDFPGVRLASAYRPAREGSDVGGDFYDAFTTPSGRWLVIGDVCGKGAEAAAVTAMVRHSTRALAFQRSSPAEVLHAVNEVMLSHAFSERFATVVLVRLDLSRRPVTAVIANAGHVPPILLSPDGSTSSLAVSGMLLGVTAQASSSELSVRLEPGATLILYTDGLTDAGAPRQELSLREIATQLAGAQDVPPAELVRLLEELALARGVEGLRDDIAIVAARVDP